MNGTTTAASPQRTGKSDEKGDLDRRPTWAKFEFDGDFDLKQPSSSSATASTYLGGTAAANGSIQGGPRADSKGRSAGFQPSTSASIAGPPSSQQTKGRRTTPDTGGSGIPPMPTHYNTLAQGLVQLQQSPKQSSPKVPSSFGAAAVAPGPIGIPVSALSQHDWAGSPTLEPEFPDGFSRPSPRSRSSVERAKFTPTNGQRAFSAVSQTSTPRDLQRPEMSPSTVNSSPSHGATFDSSVVTTPKASGSVNYFVHQQQTARRTSALADSVSAPAPLVHRPFSSADAYNQPDPILASLADGQSGDSRPETAASIQSGEGWISEGAGNRSSYSTNYSVNAKESRRMSALSFQTAMSGNGLDGFVSGDDARASSRGGADDNFDEANEGPSRVLPTDRLSARDSIQPWLQSASSNYSGYGTSPDERTLPGALPSGAWGEATFSNSTSSSPAMRTLPLRNSYRHSPTTLKSALPPLPSTDSSQQQQQRQQQVSPPLPAKATPAPPPPPINTRLPPIQMQPHDMARAPPPSMLTIPLSSFAAGGSPSSGTIGPSSDAGQTATALPVADATAAPSASTAWMESPRRPLAFDEPSRTGPPPTAAASPSGATVAEIASTVEGPILNNVIPPPLPTDVAAAAAAQLPADSAFGPVAPAAQKPVSDFRRKPLADISPAQQAAGLAHLQSMSEPGRGGVVVASEASRRASEANGGAAIEAGAAGAAAAAAASATVAADSAPDTNAAILTPVDRQRRASSASLLPMAALAQPPPSAAANVAMLERATSPSIEAPSREASPPPDGEVEARAEWERTQMKRKQRKEESAAAGRTSRTTGGTLRSQLKPLQLVPADSLMGSADDVRTPLASHVRDSFCLASAGSGGGGPRRTSGAGLDTDDGAAKDGQAAAASDAVVSTQQLQRNQAREQRRSVGAFSASMAAANAVSGGSNGPYPVFASPTVMTKKGSRQYPGIMPQRSLVPPFELQNRPDGLPSGLIGPDGIRRSINDPEVCLECMMRDEDMIDVQVVGEGIWERESDKEFNEAMRLEAEEISRPHPTAATAEEHEGSLADHHSSNHHGSSSQRHTLSSSERAQSRNSGLLPRPSKKLGKGEPLTSERLKLHTQMNPPASSHRWRTLQTFLAVQAKYIAMESDRLRIEAERRRAAAQPGHASPESERSSPVPAAGGVGSSRDFNSNLRNRSSSGSLLRNAIVMDDDGLSSAEREDKLRDIASACAARNKMAGIVSSEPPSLPVPASASPLQPAAPRAAPPQQQQPPVPTSVDDASLGRVRSSGRGAAASLGRRTVSSTQELRPPSGTVSSPVLYPPSPAESLAPPFRLFVPNSPSALSRLASRSGASQLSLMHNGSMVNMHVALEDRTEHRLNQAGFIPGTPIPMESPGAMSRSFYGFPGDGEVPAPDLASAQAKVVPGEGYVDPERARPEGMRASGSPARDESFKRKKKGFRGFFSKLTGSGASTSNLNSSNHNASVSGAGSINGSGASRNASKRSRSSSSPRATSASLPYDPTVDPVPSPALAAGGGGGSGGLISKAGKSMSLFTDPTQPTSAADEAILRSRSQSQLQSLPAPFQYPPGMASQTSLDLGPFQQQPGSSGPGASPAYGGKRASNFVHSSLANGADAAAPSLRKGQSNPMMQTYLQSPVVASQGPILGSPTTPPPPGSPYRNDGAPGPNAGTTTAAKGWSPSADPMKGYSSSRSLASVAGNNNQRDSTPWTIPENSVNDRADLRSVSSNSRNSLRKELPPMPPQDALDLGSSGGQQPQLPAKQHSRSGSNSGLSGPIPPGRQSMSGSYGNRGPPASGCRTSGGGAWQMASDTGGRRSMQVGRPSIPFTSPPLSPQQRLGNTSPEGSFAGSSSNDGPKRPPRNPRRPDQMTASPSFSSSTAESESNAAAKPSAGAKPNSFGQAMTIETDFPAGPTYDMLPKRLSTLDLTDEQQRKSKDKSRTSKLLRLPFGRKKRDSSVGTASPSVFASGGIENLAEAESRRSNLGLGPPPMLRNRQSYSGLAPPKSRMQAERQRVLSSLSNGRVDMPPRSHSAFGMLSTQRFASTSQTRLSTDGGGERRRDVGERSFEGSDEDEGDDGMGFDRDYQPGPYGSSGLTVPREGGGRRNSTSIGGGGVGGDSSFGRKSLNLLREGFRMPSSTRPAGPEEPRQQQQRKKRFGF